MAVLTDYKGLDVVEGSAGAAGVALTENFKALADRAPYEAGANPSSTDDSSQGFSSGDRWLNTSTQVLWSCVSAGVGTAVWKSVERRTSTALTLIPQESSEEVQIAGALRVQGTGASSLAGNVGIGTTTPQATLEVLNVTDPRLRLTNDGGASVTPGIELYRNANDCGVIRHTMGGGINGGLKLGTSRAEGCVAFHTASNLTLGTNERMRVSSAGDVGIGTNDPKVRLHSTGSTIVGASTAAAADADLGNGQVNFWVDQTNHKLMVKVKYSNGTVKSGSVTLT